MSSTRSIFRELCAVVLIATFTIALLAVVFGIFPNSKKGTPFITTKVNSAGEVGTLALSQQLGVPVFQGSYFSGGTFTNVVLVNETGTFPNADLVRGIVEEELEKTNQSLLWISITIEPNNGHQVTSGVKGTDPNPAPDGTRRLILNK